MKKKIFSFGHVDQSEANDSGLRCDHDQHAIYALLRSIHFNVHCLTMNNNNSNSENSNNNKHGNSNGNIQIPKRLKQSLRAWQQKLRAEMQVNENNNNSNNKSNNDNNYINNHADNSNNTNIGGALSDLEAGRNWNTRLWCVVLGDIEEIEPRSGLMDKDDKRKEMMNNTNNSCAENGSTSSGNSNNAYNSHNLNWRVAVSHDEVFFALRCYGSRASRMLQPGAIVTMSGVILGRVFTNNDNNGSNSGNQ